MLVPRTAPNLFSDWKLTKNASLESFVNLWMGPEYYAVLTSNLLINLMVLQIVSIQNDANIIDLTLDLRKKVWLGLVSPGRWASLSVVLVRILKIGILGLTTVFICGQSIIGIVYALLVGHCLQISPYSQLKEVIRPALVIALSFVLVSLLGNPITLSSRFWLVPGVGATMSLYSLIIFYAGIPPKQSENLLRPARKVFITERNN